MREEIIGDCRLILGDCREAIASFSACFQPQAIVTDPPYPDFLADEFGFDQSTIVSVLAYPCQQFVFWSATADFPLDWSAVHIWHKPNGQSVKHYERIFERNGGVTCKVYRIAAILPNYTQYAAECVDHPTQKPLKLIFDLVGRTDGTVLDPFMGSGTTGVACTQRDRPFIGIERDPSYFDIAVRRIEEAYKQPRLFSEPAPKVQQGALFDGD